MSTMTMITITIRIRREGNWRRRYWIVEGDTWIIQCMNYWTSECRSVVHSTRTVVTTPNPRLMLYNCSTPLSNEWTIDIVITNAGFACFACLFVVFVLWCWLQNVSWKTVEEEHVTSLMIYSSDALKLPFWTWCWEHGLWTSLQDIYRQMATTWS